MKTFNKLLILLLFSILCTENISAQKNSIFVGLRFGKALPLGEMASHEFGYGGYALLGNSFGAEAAWFVTPKIGIGIDISTHSFGFASGFYAEDYLENTPEYNSVDLLSGPYSLKTYMGGFYYKQEISSRFHSTFKLMGGIFKARTPDQFYGVNLFMVGNRNFWRTGSSDIKFTFLTGASLEYKLYEKVSLLLQADFTYAQAAFDYTSSSSTYTDHLHMPIFKLQPGINIYF